jgi:flagellin
MIINHNISAMSANRTFASNVQRMENKMQVLSQGERITKAGDDPSGLAVSEKMRAQVRGLNQANRNIQDAISLVQTTEGHLKETNDVLHRMRELTVQSANGTYNQEDRAQITVELDEMVKELNRIHEDAKFNTMRLLDGQSMGVNSFGGQVGSGPDSAAINSARNLNFNADNVADNPGRNGLVVQSGANTDERMFLDLEIFNTNGLGITGTPETAYTNASPNGVGFQAWREQSFYQASGYDLDAHAYLESALDTVRDDVKIENLVPLTSSDGKVNRLDITGTEKSTQSITVVDIALNKVNKQRADLGSFQNRLEKASEGVQTASENLQAAESRIRDADMAKEFVQFTKDQILSQSSSSMVAQANMRSQLVMRILG